MSCKWGSNFVWVGNDESNITVSMDDRAKIVDDVPEWKVAEQWSKSNANRLAVPPQALDIVTTGELKSHFTDHYVSTIGCSFKVSTKLDLGNGKFAKAQLWDTAGQERFRTIGRSYYRGADVFLVVFDISCSGSTVRSIHHWIEEFKRYGTDEDAVCILLGNKLDLEDERKIQFEEVRQFAEENNVYFIEVSAKSGQNLDRAFARLYSEAYMSFWSQGRPFEMIKICIIGDSGVGKTSLFDRLEGFAIDLSPLADAYPIESVIPLTVEKKVDTSWFSLSKEEVPLRKKTIKIPDTNIISLNLGLLGAWVDKCELATGDPELCSECGSAFSATDKVINENKKSWTCQYCFTDNLLNLEPEEFPRSNEVDYLQRGTPVASSFFVEDNSLIVFCIDTSGSMTVTSAIDAKDATKLRKTKQAAPETTVQDAQSQYLPNEKRGVKYISRLEAVQQAIEAQLIDLQMEHPDRGAVLVSFSSDVTVYGDGLHDATVVAGDHLSSLDYLADISKWWTNRKSKPAPEVANVPVVLTEDQKRKLTSASTNQDIMNILSESKPAVPEQDVSDSVVVNPIVKSRMALSTKLFSLYEEGQTALGPGLLVCCAIASIRPGSKVVLCTDGIANIGVGSMEGGSVEEVKQFYRTVAENALKNNITISLMGFKGSDSNVEVLGEMATKTGGQVDIVDPADVNKNLQHIFADDTVARDIVIKIFLPNTFVIPSISQQLDEWEVVRENKMGKIYCKKLGSINSDSNILIPFELEPGKNINIPPSVSFQIQVKYTRVEDGKTLLRVFSRSLLSSSSRTEVDQSADLEVMGLYAMRSVAQTAQIGNYTKARIQNYAQLQVMKRLVAASKVRDEASEILKKYVTHNKKFEHQMFREQTKEIAQGKSWDDTEFDPKDEGFSAAGVLSSVSSLFSYLVPGPMAVRAPAPAPAPEQDRRNTTQFEEQRKNRGDDVSNLLWNMRGANML